MKPKSSTIETRIRNRLVELDMTQAELARAIPVNPQNITNWFKRNSIPANMLMAVASALHVRTEWLLKGKEPISTGGLQNTSDNRTKLVTQSNITPEWANTASAPILDKRVPEITWAIAKTQGANLTIGLLDEREVIRYWRCPVEGSAQTFALRVHGDSMASSHGKSYPDGCLIFVDPAQTSQVGDRVIAKINGHSELTFRQLAHDGIKQFLKPLNPR